MNIQVETVYKSALKLTAALTPAGTYVTILNEAKKLTKAKYGSIFLYKNRHFKRVYSNVPPTFQSEPRKSGYSYQAFLSKKTIVVSADKLAEAHEQYTKNGVKTVVIIPLTFESHKLGIITLDVYRDITVTDKDLQILQLFGSLASLKLRSNMLYDELKKALETRDLFISMASHELKTPLTTISAYAQLIHANLLKGKPIKSAWTETMHSATGRMVRLINELFDINQIRSGKMAYSFEVIDPLKLVKQALTDFKNSYKDHRVTLVDERDKKDIKIKADQDKLIQVFVNILNNAGKFSPPEKEITVEVCNADRKLILAFSDQGPGISPEDLKNMFSEFYKGKTNRQEGLGLGLFISKKIVEAHNGTIDVSSKLGKGTTFRVILPVSRRK